MQVQSLSFHTHIEKSLRYREYRQMIDELLMQGKTTGPNQSQELIEYTKLNNQRMKRLDKEDGIQQSLKSLMKNLEGDYFWLILTEAWCGDAAQNIPWIEKIAALNERVKTGYLLRDEYLELMDQFLTDGGRSIPKVLFLKKSEDGDWELKDTWGPRPQEAQEMVKAYQAEPSTDFKNFVAQVHGWYHKNKGQNIQEEFKSILSTW